MVRNVFLMPKIIPEKDWCDSGILEFELDAEWSNYKTTGYNPYGGVSNAPSSEYMNYTQYANYSQNRGYQSGSSGYYGPQYPNINYGPSNEGIYLFIY